jgi:hypothetical protein
MAAGLTPGKAATKKKLIRTSLARNRGFVKEKTPRYPS